MQKIEEGLAISERILKLDISMAKSAHFLVDSKQKQLDDYMSSRDSLTSWIAARQGTYAWKLLEALRNERTNIEALQSEIEGWIAKPTKEFYEKSLNLKKAFLRRFRLGLFGILGSFLMGFIVNLIINALGLSLIFNVLAFIGFNNPLSWVPKVLGISAGVSWIFAIFKYFRSYYQWKKELIREVNTAKSHVRAVKKLAEQKPRIIELHSQMESYLALIAEILHKPWNVDEEWLNYESEDLDHSKLPTSLVLAKPKPIGLYDAITKRCLAGFVSGEWRTQQVKALFDQYELLHQMPKGSMDSLFDGDSKLREKLMGELNEGKILKLVGDFFVKEQAKNLQSNVLPKETGFYVGSITPDPLANLDFSTSYFDENQNEVDWSTFVSQILGPATDWSSMAYSQDGIFGNLAKSSEISSFALIPERLAGNLGENVQSVVVPKDEATGIEVVIRVDVSSWIDPNMVAILDGKKVNIKGVESQRKDITTSEDVIRG